MMRFIYALLFIIISVSFAFAQVNLITNGGFEDWTGGLPDFWEFRIPGPHIQAIQETDTLHGGTYSCKIYFTTQTQSQTDFTNSSPSVIPGQTYTYNAWVFDNDPAGRARLAIAWFDSAGGFLSVNYSGTYSVDSSDWQLLTFQKEAPANAAYADARFRFYDVYSNWDGDCTIFLDDAEFLGPGQNAPVITNVLWEPFPANQPITIPCDVTISSGTIDTVKLYYYTNLDTISLDSTLMSYTGSGDQYSATISALPNASSLIYWVKAWGNGLSSQTPEYKVLTGIPDIALFHTQQDTNGLPLHLDHLTRLRGLVTVSSGVFATTRYDFYIQDNTGGINVFSFDTPVTVYNEGDSLEIVGTIDQYRGKVEIVNWQITILNSGNPLPAPINVNCADMSELFEGRLITIDNVSLAPGSDPWITTPPDTSFNITITDGTGDLTLRVVGSTDIGGNPEPSWPVTVQGIGSQYDPTFPYTEGYQILPRRYSDILPGTLSFDKTVTSGWNMLGLPLDPPDPYYLTLFPNAIPNTLFRFNGSYIPEDSLEMGIGYWLRFSEADTVTISGNAVDSLDITLLTGWNMIAGISCDVPLPAVNDPNSIIIPNTLFGFDGTYYNTDTLKQGNGYWIRSSDSGTVSLSCGAKTSQTLAQFYKKLPDPNQFPALRIRDGKGATQTLFFNVTLPEGINKLSYSLPPLPPTGAFDARFSGDYRICEGDEAMIEVQASTYPLTINAENLPELPEGYRYVIREILPGGEGKVHVLSEGQNVEITKPQVKSLQLGKQEIVPLTFAVEQNYPNPFNPTTEIRYSIPADQRVEIVVYNTLGQKMKTLLSAKQEAGRHTVVWDATNENGQQVSSGIYFYTVTAGSNKVVKKMILLR